MAEVMPGDRAVPSACPCVPARSPFHFSCPTSLLWLRAPTQHRSRVRHCRLLARRQPQPGTARHGTGMAHHGTAQGSLSPLLWPWGARGGHREEETARKLLPPTTGVSVGVKTRQETSGKVTPGWSGSSARGRDPPHPPALRSPGSPLPAAGAAGPGWGRGPPAPRWDPAPAPAGRTGSTAPGPAGPPHPSPAAPARSPPSTPRPGSHAPPGPYRPGSPGAPDRVTGSQTWPEPPPPNSPAKTSPRGADGCESPVPDPFPLRFIPAELPPRS